MTRAIVGFSFIFLNSAMNLSPLKEKFPQHLCRGNSLFHYGLLMMVF
jgi:hypothetical protein